MYNEQFCLLNEWMGFFLIILVSLWIFKINIIPHMIYPHIPWNYIKEKLFYSNYLINKMLLR